MAMSGIQRFVTSIVPKKWAASMEAHSRRWIITCNCGFARSIWDLGGIRWNTRGHQRNYGYCPACKKRSWHKLLWTPEAPGTAGSDPAAS